MGRLEDLRYVLYNRQIGKKWKKPFLNLIENQYRKDFISYHEIWLPYINKHFKNDRAIFYSIDRDFDYWCALAPFAFFHYDAKDKKKFLEDSKKENFLKVRKLSIYSDLPSEPQEFLSEVAILEIKDFHISEPFSFDELSVFTGLEKVGFQPIMGLNNVRFAPSKVCRLSHLHLDFLQINNAALSVICASFPLLESISLRFTNINQEGLKFLIQATDVFIPHLRNIYTSHKPVPKKLQDLAIEKGVFLTS